MIPHGSAPGAEPGRDPGKGAGGKTAVRRARLTGREADWPDSLDRTTGHNPTYFERSGDREVWTAKTEGARENS